MNFFHVEKCKHDNFSVSFRYKLKLYIHDPCHGAYYSKKQDIKELINYCKMRKEQFVSARFFMHRLAEIEREKVLLDKSFDETLKLWSSKEKELSVPPQNIQE